MNDARPTFFATPDDFRAWLAEHHANERELWVGFHRKSTGRPSITWPEAVDQALCYGWIDGVRRSVDGTSYMNRFTPRTARSTWSAVNIRRAKELIAAGLMQPAGMAAFQKRSDERSAIYSYEQRHSATLDPGDEQRFRANRAAWDWFQAQAPSYRTAAAHWVVSAKREETRQRRLGTLIDHSARARRVPPLAPPQRAI